MSINNCLKQFINYISKAKKAVITITYRKLSIFIQQSYIHDV